MFLNNVKITVFCSAYRITGEEKPRARQQIGKITLDSCDSESVENIIEAVQSSFIGSHDLEFDIRATMETL